MTARGVSKTFTAMLAAATIDTKTELGSNSVNRAGTLRFTNLNGSNIIAVKPIFNGVGAPAALEGDDCIHILPNKSEDISYAEAYSIIATADTIKLEVRSV